MAGMSDFVRVQYSLESEPFDGTQTVTTITDQVRSLQWSQKRSGGPGGAIPPAKMSATVDNTDGRYDPSSTSTLSPYDGNITPNRQVRFLGSDDSFSTASVLGVGFLDDVSLAATKFDATATLEVSDVMRFVQEHELKDWVRPAELSGDRVTALLNEVGIPTGSGSQGDFHGGIDNGTVQLPGGTFSGSAFVLANEIMRAEGGLFYVWTGNAAPNQSQIFFFDRYTIADATRFNTSQITLDEADFLARPMLADLAAFHKVTAVSASGDSGAVLTFDSVAATDNPTTVRQQTGLPTRFDSDVVVAAEHYQKIWETGDVSRPKQIDLHIASVSGAHATNLTAIVDKDIDLFNRITVTFRPVGWSSDYTYAARIEGITHTITQEEWTVRLTLSPFTNTWQTASTNFYEFGDTLASSDRGAL